MSQNSGPAYFLHSLHKALEGELEAECERQIKTAQENIKKHMKKHVAEITMRLHHFYDVEKLADRLVITVKIGPD
jgi:hypothetical protein